MFADLLKTLLDGTLLSICASGLILISMRINPRIWLHDYPQDIQALVPPKTDREKQLSLAFGVPFLALLFAVPFISTLMLKNNHPGALPFLPLVVHAFGVMFVFNLVDWLLLDWLIFCAITPRFLVIPGSEGARGYKDYLFHFRGFLIGTALSIVMGLIIGALVWFI